MFEIKKILCPIDFSEASLEAFEVAKSFAEKFNATLVALHVAMTPPEYSNWAPVLPVDEEDLAKRSDELAKLRREDGGRFERLVLVGDAESTIVREAEVRGCDMIVMGTAGRGGVGRLLLGSVAEHVSRKAHCPVLLVRAHAAAAASKPAARMEAVV
jgi:universal stress protein A